MCTKCKPNQRPHASRIRHGKTCRFCGWDQTGWYDGGRSGWVVDGKTVWRQDRVYKRQPDHCQCHSCYGCDHIVFRDKATTYVCEHCGADSIQTAYFWDRLNREPRGPDKYLCLDCFRAQVRRWLESIAPIPQPEQLRKAGKKNGS